MRGRRTTGIDSSDVNDYLRQVSGQDFTAKDFRTWTATVLAAQALHEMRQFDGDVEAKRNVVAAIESVAARLGNTPAVCRECYVHPAVTDAYLDGSLLSTLTERASGIAHIDRLGSAGGGAGAAAPSPGSQAASGSRLARPPDGTVASDAHH